MNWCSETRDRGCRRFRMRVDNTVNALILFARPEQTGTSPNLLLCKVFVDFGEIPDEVFADGFE